MSEVVVVELRGAPLRLWDRAERHSGELMREFSLLVIGLGSGGAAVPQRLLDLVAALQDRFRGVSDGPEQARLAAAAQGAEAIDLTYQVPVEAGPACDELRLLFDEADAYCRQGALMTLTSPPDQRAFRDWYLGEFTRQTRGESPTPWTGPLT